MNLANHAAKKRCVGVRALARVGKDVKMPLLPPLSQSNQQKARREDIKGVLNESFGSFIVAREDGALIRSFNAMLHFPGHLGPSTRRCVK